MVSGLTDATAAGGGRGGAELPPQAEFSAAGKAQLQAAYQRLSLLRT